MSTRTAGVFVACFLAVYVAVSLFGESTVGVVVVDLMSACAVCVAGWGATRRSSNRGTWMLIVAVLTMWLVGDLIWDYFVLTTGDTPAVSWADAFYLGAYPLFALALGYMVLIRARDRWREGLLDGLGLAIVASLAVWQFLIAGSGATPNLEGVITAAYPLADMVLLAAFVWLVLSPGRRPASSTFMFCGILSIMVLDLALSIMAHLGAETSRQWLDNAYPVVYLAIALGVAHHSADDIIAPTAASDNRLHPGRVVFLGVALFGAPTLGVLAPSGSAMPQWVLLIVTIGVGILVLARFLKAVRDVETARQELGHQAAHDSLTGLVNRGELMSQLEGALQRWRSDEEKSFGQVVVYFLDLDMFKPVNDTHGHAAGDELLAKVGERLCRSVRTYDTVGRLGGDEFCIVAERLDPLLAADVGRRLVAAIAVPFVLECGEVALTASVGIAIPGSPQVTADQVVSDADTALYDVKRSGRNNFKVASVGVVAADGTPVG